MNSSPLVLLRSDHPSDTPETELATVERHADRVLIVLDDGVTLNLDAAELASAVQGSRGGRASHRRAA